MITGVIKNKVDKIWTDIWAGDITNPLTVIEQLTYLMFIRSLDEKELETEEFEHMTGEKMEKIFPQSTVGQSMRWSKFKNNDQCNFPAGLPCHQKHETWPPAGLHRAGGTGGNRRRFQQ